MKVKKINGFSKSKHGDSIVLMSSFCAVVITIESKDKYDEFLNIMSINNISAQQRNISDELVDCYLYGNKLFAYRKLDTGYASICFDAGGAKIDESVIDDVIESIDF